MEKKKLSLEEFIEEFKIESVSVETLKTDPIYKLSYNFYILDYNDYLRAFLSDEDKKPRKTVNYDLRAYGEKDGKG